MGERERGGDRGVTERLGEAECAERGLVGEAVGEGSRVGLRACKGAGEGEGDGMVWFEKVLGVKRWYWWMG